MATALISALTRRPVSRYVAMTGEITLRGRILPIGGLKEKCLAALHAGIKTIIVPDRNDKDLDEIPKPVRRKLTLIKAKNMSDVLKAALLDKAEKRAAAESPAKTPARKPVKRKEKPLEKVRRDRIVPLRAG
jgi:ATP-dependent Lon protease